MKSNTLSTASKLQINPFSARVQPPEEFCEKSLSYRVYKYFLFIILSFFIIYLVAELFTVLSPNELHGNTNDLIPGLPNTTLPEQPNRGISYSQLIWSISMLSVKGLTFTAVFWENLKLVYVSLCFTLLSLVANVLIKAYLPVISEALVTTCLTLFAWKTHKESKNGLDFK